MNFGNNEIWRAIDGYLNYEVSSHGRIRNSNTGRILKQRMCNRGYDRACLYKNGEGVNYAVHRLVCIAFNENKNNYNIVDHIDRNTRNNFYENLRWTTNEGNTKNMKTRKTNKSGTQGVSFYKNSKDWVASWSVDRKTHRKCFKNKEDAINHRKEMEALHGYL
jgi:hypothetical protein